MPFVPAAGVSGTVCFQDLRLIFCNLHVVPLYEFINVGKTSMYNSQTTVQECAGTDSWAVLSVPP